MILNCFNTTKNYVKFHRNKLHLLIVIAELHCPSSPVYSQIFQYPVKVYMYIRMYVRTSQTHNMLRSYIYCEMSQLLTSAEEFFGSEMDRL